MFPVRSPVATGDEMPIHNSDVADMLDEIADLLVIERADRYRIRAYRNAAQTIRRLERLDAEGFLAMIGDR